VIFGIRKPSHWTIVWHSLRDPTFSRFDTISECDRHTHMQTDRLTHDDGICRASIASRGKNRDMQLRLQLSAHLHHWTDRMNFILQSRKGWWKREMPTGVCCWPATPLHRTIHYFALMLLSLSPPSSPRRKSYKFPRRGQVLADGGTALRVRKRG